MVTISYNCKLQMNLFPLLALFVSSLMLCLTRTASNREHIICIAFIHPWIDGNKLGNIRYTFMSRRFVHHGEKTQSSPLQYLALDSRDIATNMDGGNANSQDIKILGKGQTSIGTAEKNRFAHFSYANQPKPSALCMPQGIRGPGCAPLIDTSTYSQSVGTPLPCVEKGICPFISFKCSRGHTWKAVAGAPVCFFCPRCKESEVRGHKRKRDINIESINEVAVRQGGECISATYKGLSVPLEFKCQEGHTWNDLPKKVLSSGIWCPTCNKRNRREGRALEVSDMHKTAASFGGEFLSDNYYGVSKKHLWRCANGHQFEQTPNAIRRSAGGKRKSSFCPKCGRSRRSKKNYMTFDTWNTSGNEKFEKNMEKLLVG